MNDTTNSTMRLPFDSLPAAKVAPDMMQVTVSSKGKEGKEKPFQTFYVTLPSNYLAPLHAAVKLVPWAANALEETVRALVRDAARNAKLRGEQAVELARTCEQQVIISSVSVTQELAVEWLATKLLPALVPGKDTKSYHKEAKQRVAYLFNGATLERLERVSGWIARAGLDDVATQAIVAFIAKRVEELTSEDDDLLAFGALDEEEETTEAEKNDDA